MFPDDALFMSVIRGAGVRAYKPRSHKHKIGRLRLLHTVQNYQETLNIDCYALVYCTVQELIYFPKTEKVWSWKEK